MGKTFYFIEMSNFDLTENGFFTSQQLTLDSTKKDADPLTYLKIVDANFYKGYMRLEGLHESIDKTPRRLAGDLEYLTQSIVGGDKPFDCYFNPDNNILIMNTSKHNVIGLQRRLIKNFPKTFVPQQGELDFKHLLNNLSNSRIIGSWFNNIQGKVNAIGLFGERVNLDDIFRYYNDLGKLSAITVEWLLEDVDQPLNIMFTKKFGVVLNSTWDKKNDLDFLIKILPLLFEPETSIL